MTESGILSGKKIGEKQEKNDGVFMRQGARFGRCFVDCLCPIRCGKRTEKKKKKGLREGRFGCGSKQWPHGPGEIVMVQIVEGIAFVER